jgi:hypothetical protein
MKNLIRIRKNLRLQKKNSENISCLKFYAIKTQKNFTLIFSALLPVEDIGLNSGDNIKMDIKDIGWMARGLDRTV